MQLTINGEEHQVPDGLSVRALIDQTREANARALLGDRSLSLDDVAFLLGYSNESALRRAFKRWTGETPSAFRRTLS